MKFTYDWLKDFVEIKLTPQQLAEKLTMAGLEVTSLEEKAGDYVFEIEVTSNRPDWLSVIGIAREVAAITGKKIKEAAKPKGKHSGIKKYTEKFGLEIENKKDCPLYTARIIRGVKVGASPEWLSRRLELVGCRSVNNVVDITNYILFTFGEPLHAFDLDRLKGGKIIVRRAKNKEKITTIDGGIKELDENILVIADQDLPVAVAGVMGGKPSEVTRATSNILLEAAVFDPVLIRRGRRALGLASESSYRFERAVNIAIVESASLRAQELLQEICAGECVLVKSSARANVKNRLVTLDVQQVNKFLGIGIPAAKIKSILSALGFKLKGSQKKFNVEIPDHRQDVSCPVDLMEELARIYGFENIPSALPSVKPRLQGFQERDALILIKEILVGLGLQEVITYSMVDRGMLEGLSPGVESLAVANPLSSEQEVLRLSLMPSLSKVVAYNLQQKAANVSIFEIAKVYHKTGKENYNLCVALCGVRTLWLGPQNPHINDEAGFLHLKGIINVLLQRLGIKHPCEFLSGQRSGEYFLQLKDQSFKAGLFKKLAKETLNKLDIKHRDVFLAELDLEKIIPFMRRVRKIQPPARYPGISRDISCYLPEEITFEMISQQITQNGGSLLQEVQLTDFYIGEHIPAGHKGMTVSCLYASAERTLTDAEVNTSHALVLKALQEKLGASIR